MVRDMDEELRIREAKASTTGRTSSGERVVIGHARGK